MKKCKYCGTLNDDPATSCKACSASDFVFICDNCGSEIDHGAYCSRCGVRIGSVRQICPKCGTAYYTNACPNCGYTRHRSGESTVRIETVPVEVPKKKRSGWAMFGLILLWIYFLPIMGTIAVWKSKKLSTLSKVIITVAIWGLILLFYSESN